MAKRRRVRLRGTRTTAKAEQKRILERLTALRDDPELLLPDCDRRDDRCSYCPYPRVLRELRRARERQLSPPSRLGRLLGSRIKDATARAYGASLAALSAGEVPVVAVARYPAGEVSYVTRGGHIPKEKYIGVQNYHHQVWRTLTHVGYMKAARIHLYSLPDQLWCTGRDPRYPAELWEQVQVQLPRGALSEGKGEGLTLRCRSLDRCVHLPPAVWKRSRLNTYRQLVSHQMAPAEDIDFAVEALTPLSEAAPAPEKLLQAYRAGEITDRQFRQQLVEAQLAAIVASDEPQVVLGERVVEPPAVPAALGLEGRDRRLAEALLEGLAEPLVLAEATLAALARERWQARGRALAEEWAPGTARGYSGDNALQLLRQAWRQHAEAQTLAALPRYRNLPPPLALADRAARKHLVEAPAAVLKLVEQECAREASSQPVGWALLTALKRADGEQWRFGHEERAFGEELAPAAAELLAAGADDYHAALEALARAAGLATPLETV